MADDVDPFAHYREKHNNIPPWIVVKGMTFGNLRMFVHLLKQADQQELIQHMYIPIKDTMTP